ncbi:mediator of RNA polymerase II transcription subunit 1-like [Hyla sarda]|uniref:mediator of RNA polymerase II transcription subunit 1-like n=1 Tax=Hyla sarda TaxID=327740 RepID=UPI0024C38855|nr:mediator of RNA polymerase II transcription subunit 1-like [Hyla sarda]
MPRDVLARVHFYHIKKALMAKSRHKGSLPDQYRMISLYTDLSAVTLQIRRKLAPLTAACREHKILYKWGFPTRLLIHKNERLHVIRCLQDGLRASFVIPMGSGWFICDIIANSSTPKENQEAIIVALPKAGKSPEQPFSTDQVGFVQGRQTYENTRRVLNLHHVGSGCVPSVFLALDAEKVFDCIHWGYAFSVLQAPAKRSSKALLEKLHSKYSQKSWAETYKLVRYCLFPWTGFNKSPPRSDKPAAATIKGLTEHPIVRCTNTVQEAIKAKSLSTLLTRIESISKQKGLESHLGPNGRICYITSEMFYIEVQVKKNGHVAFVKLAHHGESPTICQELLLLLRNKDFEGFGKSLEGLLHLYSIPGNSDIKAKVYVALRSLEEDMSALFNLSRLSNDKDRITTILQGQVGFVSFRSGGTPMNIQYYISPYQILEEKLKPGIRVVGTNVSVTVAGTTNWYHLQVTPLFQEIEQEGGSIHRFSSLTDESSMALPACFFLRFDTPEPVLLTLIQKIQNITGLPVVFTKQGPMHELVIGTKHKRHTDLVSQEIQFVVSISGCKDHCYVVNSRMGGENAVIGALVSKIPFIHPSHIPSILEVLRHQAAYNTLIYSCISSTIKFSDHTRMLHFEVSLQREFKICISFQHPKGGSLSCVVVEVLNCRKIMCSLHTSSSDPPSPCNSDFIMKVMESCMSIPLTMRTIFKKAQEAEVSEDMVINCVNGNNVLPQSCSEYQKEAAMDQQPSIPHDMQPTFQKNIPNNLIYDHNEDIFPDENDALHSVDEPCPYPAQELSSSYTEDSYFHPVEISSSGVDEHNSTVAEQSYSSVAEEPSSSIVQELSPIMAEVPSPNLAEDPSSSITGELSSSITEELSLSVSGLVMARSIPEHEMDECYS